jgi:hypothetical protein
MRSWLLRLVAIVLLLGLAVGVRTERADACDCAPPTVREAFDWSAAVFSGRLVSAEGSYPFALTFEVFRVWKGAVTETQVVMTSSLGAGDCGYPFRELGVDYLIYAEADGPELWVWLCGGTGLLEYAGDDLGVLGEGWLPGQEPVGTGSGAEEGDPPGTQPLAVGDTGTGLASGPCAQESWAIGLLMVAGVGLAGLGLVALRRRARET